MELLFFSLGIVISPMILKLGWLWLAMTMILSITVGGLILRKKNFYGFKNIVIFDLFRFSKSEKSGLEFSSLLVALLFSFSLMCAGAILGRVVLIYFWR